ncbi:copper amine oxidase N-terminal domain-containing protein [Paenibacillus woosongensis]|uniref:Copper amine oxidase N-terminal domain-containing protein n=1 Tax=Paenibacillus woosongensis TaxID=307580 RepID=A0AA95I8A4_9BACL|nr:copper amine oxidase N-terminal domain-containing protein [Paenibacillus woosongensis]WHX47013.1 copper amine oxidase N-terminal domain-containing protein [Paenibacillus woosongensis]
MKKISFVALIAIMVFAIMPISASAFMGKRDVVVDGFALSGGAIDKNNITFVPFRELFTQLGLTVGYDSKSKKVTGTKGELHVTFTIGSKKANINGVNKTLQVAPFNSNGSVYVPLRIVSEATGSTVVHLKDVDIVLVNSPSFEGLIYDSPSGSLEITKEGELTKTNNLVLIDFLDFLPEEEIVYQKDISSGTNHNYKVTLTPDAVIEYIED